MNQTAAFQDVPASRCVYYRTRCGLAAQVHPPIGRITVPAGSAVWGVRMRAALGQQVKRDLERREHAVGPIVSHIRSRTWTFLVRPDFTVGSELLAQLFRAEIAIYREGSEIALPSPTDRPLTQRVWIDLPRDTFRPSGALLFASISRCLPPKALTAQLMPGPSVTR